MSNAPTTAAVTVIRNNSLRARNGLNVNRVAVDNAWKVLMIAGRELDPKICRRDQALVVLGVGRDALYGGSSVAGFGGSTSAVVTGKN